MARIGLGGGCHWCTEGVFQSLRGVVQVDQGFLRSDPPADAWAEGVIVTFAPAAIPLDILVEVHLRTHSGASGYSPGGRYRSAVYWFAEDQAARAETTIARIAADSGTRMQTAVLRFAGFDPSPERYRDYYRTDPNRPFCRRYIDPKLAVIRRDFAAFALPDTG
ncbi:peptide-methionine (S)-S-oxide reductase [Sphingomonas silueang]|uniref:peptide-methionine (S)-S-oxide reductase n=1 Tax=Sphingomonas silueang TaxID=3156617 RepID=UPI0032B37CAA